MICANCLHELPLSKGQVAAVDAEDYEALSAHKWSALWNPESQTFYAVRCESKDGKQRYIYMHREIAASSEYPMVDHRDGNGLNNRRYNLRPCCNSKNQRNRRLPSNSTTGYKGVSRMKGTDKFRAYINENGKQIHLGIFTEAEAGARAYDAEAMRRFGEFARLNFSVEASA
jgi:hypothetical protein